MDIITFFLMMKTLRGLQSEKINRRILLDLNGLLTFFRLKKKQLKLKILRLKNSIL